jgi:protein-S-isoprenylcysteine O-methyltransferase Ste14
MIRKALVLGYGTIVYVAFLALFAYTIGFLANVAVPKGIDDGPTVPTSTAIVIDLGLLGAFAVQHSVMARPWFKRWWTRLVPAAVERSTYVLAATAAVALLLWQWRPLPATVWSAPAGLATGLLWTLYATGWAILVLSTFLIGHFDLFGLRQVSARARERRYTEPDFRQPLLYRLVRHPIMVGFIIAFWATPQMSAGRLLFAVAATGYILVAVRFEEHDLRRHLGERYQRYERDVPRFVPRLIGARRRRTVPERRVGD